MGFVRVAVVAIAIAIAIVIVVVVIGNVASAATQQAVESVTAAPPPRLLSDAQVAALASLAVVALIASVVVGISAGAGWSVAPLLMWAIAFFSMRSAARQHLEAVRQREAAAKRQQEKAAKNARKEKRHRTERLAAAARHVQQENIRVDEKRRVEALGKQGAALVNRAKAAVRQIVSSEAARDGWLGDIEFAPDIAEIEASLLKAQALQGKSDELSAWPKPSDDDRKIIAEVRTTTARLERKAEERVELVEKCASEARLIDTSLREEREEAQLAEKREELHGELAAMLYGIEATAETPSGSTADAVMARVQAYREIKGQIERARHDTDDAETARGSEAETGDNSSVAWIVASVHEAWKWVFD